MILPALFMLAAALVLPSGVSAQPADAAAELAAQLKAGDTVYVFDSCARETTGVVGRISDGSLTLMVEGELREILLSDVRQVTRRGGDSVWNGVAIGAAAGGLLGAGTQDPIVMLQTAIGWGFIGGLIDYGRKGRVVVYRAPKGTAWRMAPYGDREVRGVRVSVSF